MANYITDVKRDGNGVAVEATAQWESVEIIFGRQGNHIVELSRVNIFASRLADQDQLHIPKNVNYQISKQVRAILFPPQKKKPKPEEPKQLNLFE